MLKGTFNSVDLVNVFGKRCYTIGRQLNLITEENYEEALKEAADRDIEREAAKRNGIADTLPIFHGIPISVKDLVSYHNYLQKIIKFYLDILKRIQSNSRMLYVCRRNHLRRCPYTCNV